jgi:hypothetical protein
VTHHSPRLHGGIPHQLHQDIAFALTQKIRVYGLRHELACCSAFMAIAAFIVSKTDAGKGAATERIGYWPCILGHEMNTR